MKELAAGAWLLVCLFGCRAPQSEPAPKTTVVSESPKPAMPVQGFNLGNLYTDVEAQQFKEKLDNLVVRSKEFKEVLAVLGIDPKRLGPGMGGPITMNREAETWSEKIIHPLSESYVIRVSRQDRSLPEFSIEILKYVWNRSAQPTTPPAKEGAAAKP